MNQDEMTARIVAETNRLVAAGWNRQEANRSAWMSLYAEAGASRAEAELRARLAPENVRDKGLREALTSAGEVPRARRPRKN